VGGRVLIVEDEPTQARALQMHLQADGHEVALAHDGKTALDVGTGDAALDLVLCDLRLPDMDGLEIFRRVREARGDEAPSFVILTAYGTVESAREALKSGVYDYLTKPVDPTELTFLVRNVLDQRRLKRENRELRRAAGGSRIEDRLIGRSQRFQDMVSMARSAAESDATILIRGESGTGKELVAELIHAASPRIKGPFVKVNCGAIPETLLEAELFGHERGAFTDARKARKGRFELAHGGTIFLDEVGEMSPALQVKLLRVLQERELERLGGQGQVIPIDIRLVAATNQDLEAMVREGTFREDLYYRINVITVAVPALRDRPDDIELLAEHFRARFTARNGKAFHGIAPDAMARLRAQPWPGNVRQLENVIERAVVLGHGELIRPEHLVEGETRAPATGDGRRASPSEHLVQQALESGRPLDDIERSLIKGALGRTAGNVTQAARLLGLTRRTLQYRIEKHNLASKDEGAKV
jgi:DNA-binding NtrC family response regulator